uniref:Uncharacterized protein n=1 Tax=Arundo donax TaxID=35708 RepID=A0A0A9H3N1_ARUDO
MNKELYKSLVYMQIDITPAHSFKSQIHGNHFPHSLSIICRCDNYRNEIRVDVNSN